MDHALSHLEYFDCQGHNSLNFGPIFKILVPQHISFPRPFFFIYWTSTWHMPRGQKRVLKVLHEKQKSLKLKKILLPGFIPAVFLKISSLYIIKKNLKNWKKKLFSSYIEFLGPKAETYQALLLIISWSERLLEYAIFFELSVRSFWGIVSQNLMKNGQDRARIKLQFFSVKIQNPKSKYSGGQKGPLLTNSGAPNGLRW